MRKRSGVIAFVFLLSIAAFSGNVFAAAVTYNGNLNTGGTAPIDAVSYTSGATVTVLGNTGALTKTGYSFGGWNTQADGNGTTYSAGSTFTISADTTLYAKWPGMLSYCMTPAFLQAGILPNVLLMLDNSASMFDLAYADKGKAGTCSNNATKSCFKNTDCATSGATCNNSPRKPSYCDDNTYSDVYDDGSARTYTGYFTTSFFYDYDIANGKFIKINTFPSSGDCDFYLANKFCVATDDSTPKKVTKFSASGNYLNWLTASKFDVQKKILTGGKWDGANLVAESRGCVGRGFIKQPLSSNSGNYVEGGTNTPFNISLSIKGFNDSHDTTAPSQGGQTSIYFYAGEAPLNSQICQEAINSLETANSINNTVRDQVTGCIGASGGNVDLAGKSKQIFQQSLQECWQYYKNDPDALQGNDYLTVKNFCTDVYNLRDPSRLLTDPAAAISVGDPSLLCSDKYVGACYSGQTAMLQLPSSSFFALLSPKEAFAAAGTVQFGSATYTINENGGSVTVVVKRVGGSDGRVNVTYATAAGTATAGSDYITKTGTLTWNNNNSGDQTISIVINDDNVVEGNETFTVSLSSTDIPLSSPATATVTIVDNDTAGANGTVSFDTAAPGAVNEAAGTITLRVQRLGGSTNALTANYTTVDGTATAGSDYTATSGTLSWGDGDSSVKTITVPIIHDAVAEQNETFSVTLSGVAVGTPATSTVTITETTVSLGAWPNSWTSDACVKTQHELYCAGMNVPPVTDPTNVVLDTTTNYANLPAVLADIAIEGQLGAPLKLVSGGTEYSAATVRLTAAEPSGLVQDFKDKIRIGVMSFNYNGSATECAAGTTIPCPKICSNSPDMSFPKTCVTALDCCAATDSCTCDASTANSTNRDGARILHYAGRGICTNDNSIECTAETAPSVCGVTPPENARCNVVGTHATGLINVIDNIKASNWTPFSEGFYNAIGYFARNNDGTSRTDLRINSEDFVGNRNPSTASCQQNNVLIISDGVATADQNATVKSLAATATSGTYSPNAGGVSGDCPNYKGSKNLDKLSWLAYKRKISNFAETPVDARDHITTYTVYNGAETYDAADECNSATMMKNTATKGGEGVGRFYQAVNADTMQAQLQSAFDDISAKVSSGTAAAVANNKSGERGANIIQALFYPKWPDDLEKKWMGDIQALWFYVDPVVKFSGIYEDTVRDNHLNLATDRAPGNDSLTVKALWKAGELLHARAASERTIYTLLDSTQVLTNTANEFTVTDTKRTILKPLLDVSTLTNNQVDKIINYVRGSDGDDSVLPVLRSRKVINTSEWKLGDVINSTPQIQGSDPQNKYDIEYGDVSYGKFTKSTNYKSNNYVYAGSNDGMMHAFKLGIVSMVKDPAHPFDIAVIDAPDPPNEIGREMWAFIPPNALPYLKNCSDPNYCHQFLVDGAPLLFDASINKYTGCTSSNYWDCPRQTTLSSSVLDGEHTSWRSILLGSMGLGGATRDRGASCNKTSVAGPDNKCINTPVSGKGYSSYFALDVTTPATPTLLWEFSDASIDADPNLDDAGKAATKGLGLTTPGGIQIRINSRRTATVPDKSTNGRWFAVFPSGPTGPIDTGTHQFLGQSDQNLKIYIVDMNPANGAVSGSNTGAPVFKKCTSAAATDCNYWVKDTGIKFAFANALFNSAIDIDKTDGGSGSHYSDDVVYITYTKASLDSNTPPYPVAWDKGGVLRLITNNDPDPYNWFTSKLIDDIGPVTRSVDMLQDKNNKKLWVFFGEARYFFRQDDLHTQRRIFGVADPCYSYDLDSTNQLSSTIDKCPTLAVSNLKDQSDTPDEPLTTEKGWYINLEAENANYGAERLSGGISARTNGLVLFTTFIPSMDPCDAGGLPSQWAVNFKTGGAAPPGSLQGKTIMTTSDSPIAKTINLSGAFTQRGGRKLDAALSSSLKGMPPPSPPPSLILPSPVKKILQIQEK